ncbi:MAG TPA: DUF202 domain-containing protein [Mycobacteriales bacterium]|nr:DUF202 domain-containing protein [Mycobacteriales bacterium]
MTEPPGTQAERTVLAWTRTSLSLLGGVVAVSRLAAISSLTLAIAVAAIGAPLTIAILWTINRRYHQSTRAPDGRLAIMTAALATFLGLAALLNIVLQ